jgi:shikimate dehydrogenase
LILGTGGAAKAVGFALRQLSIDYVRVSRSNRGNQVAYDELSEKMILEHTLIINTTPVGMFPNTEEAPPFPYHYLGSQHLLFDLIYNPSKTKFLQEGEQRGAEVYNGSEMLAIQAEESWRIWNET